MTRYVAFRTPGLIPLESFTTFGVNAKPNSKNPFGYFGTGLKYAIAVLLRNGCTVVLHRGNAEFTFYPKRSDFRGRDFDFVRMRRRNVLGNFTYHSLPFTLELGKNWELWQAFRELETNTRDENGETFLTTDEYYPAPHSDRTCILVSGEKFVDEFLDMGKHFLADGKTVREDEAIQVIDRPSNHIYYRGVRVMDLKEEAEFTYNILRQIDLTEDRTVKYPFLVETMIAEHIMESEEPDFVSRAVTTQRWESRGLGYGYASATPSATFRSYAPAIVNPTAKEYLKKTDPTVSPKTFITLEIPKPEVTPNELNDICRAVGEILGVRMLDARNDTSGDSMVFDADLVPEPPEEPPLEPVPDEELEPF